MKNVKNNDQDIETVGDYIAQYLADIGITKIFGVISIHNMPILDAIARQNRIVFIPARGEAGAMNMADAYSRVSESLGVCLTSTGTAAGNAAGAQAEALTAGSSILHITTQVDVKFADKDRAAIHDVPRQPEMLRGISKAYFRMWDANGAIGALTASVNAAISAPTGPVSLEIPVDVQRSIITIKPKIVLPRPTIITAPEQTIDDIVELIKSAKRPMLWLGGGARNAQLQATELMNRGLGVVTSTNGRGIVSENSNASLGAFNMTPEAIELYETCDLMIVVGSRLRGNETQNNNMPLPSPLVQIDADPYQGGRNYPVNIFANGDSTDTLQRILDKLPATLNCDGLLGFDIARAKATGEGNMRDMLGPYKVIADILSEKVGDGGHPWVRDVTISNSTFGNRFVRISEPKNGVHALGGGIGQGIAMGIGAACASQTKTIALLGDGGAMLGIAEMITAVDEKLALVYILMNDQAYGVIQNIQAAQYDSRRDYSALKTPDFGLFCNSIAMPHTKISHINDFKAALNKAILADGPQLIEVDMCTIGDFAVSFAGPPAGAAGKKGN